jgi:elongation factor 2
MPRFRQIGEIMKLMNNKERIRNIGIVAHIDHGKTTMTDSLLAEAGLLSWQVAGSARALDYLEEEQRRGITMKTANISLIHETDDQPNVINLIDTPGHVDFTGKVTRALRATDGVVVVVDAVEEVMAQTETVVRQALWERVKPILFINKIDRLINELRLEAEGIQRKLAHIITDFNNLIEIYGESEFKSKWKVDPSEETVVFGSALYKWGFSLDMIGRKGVRFADIVETCKKGQHKTLSKMLPLHDAILDAAIRNCPSPIEAQKYRVPKIWRGNLDSAVGKALLNCDDHGPTIMCVTNVQADPNEGTVATARLFSGSAKEDDRVYLIGANKEYKLKHVFVYMSAFKEVADQISAGNVAALTGLDLARAGETVVDSAHKESVVPFESMKYVSEPVIAVAIEPKNPKDLPSLAKALDRLSIEDPNLVVKIDEKTGEYMLSGMGELHLETSLKFLKDYSSGVEIVASNPTADYRESVVGKGQVVMAKSPNKQNSLRVLVKPFEEKTKNSWAFDEQNNVLVDLTEDCKILPELRDNIISGFRWACKTGPLCEQPMRNVEVNLIDARIHEEPTLREPRQIMRAMSRAVLGSFLTAKPILLEPIYKIEISTPTQWFGKCTIILASRRGKIQTVENRGNIAMITGYIPVAETFGFSAEMRSSTSGRVFWQSTFDRWERVPEKIATEVIRQTRMRKGLPPEIPKPSKFVDEI